MSLRAILASSLVVAVGFGALVWFLSSDSTLYVPDDAVRLRDKGEFLLNKRRHTTDRQKKAELLSQAIENFKKALEIKDDFEVVHNLLGHCYIERGQWETALKHLDIALQKRSDYPAALFNRAHVYQRLSVSKRDKVLIDKAIADYKQAINSDLAANFVGDIHKALADAYQNKGDIAAAITELKIYLKKAPHAQDALLVRRKIRGLTLMEKGSAPPLSAPLD